MFNGLPCTSKRTSLVGGVLLLCCTAEVSHVAQAFSTPRSEVRVSRCPYRFASSGNNDGGEKIGGWFFQPPAVDPTLQPSSSRATKKVVISDKDSSRVSILTKLEIKKVAKERASKKGDIGRKVINRLPSSPLEEIEDSSSAPFVDASNPRTIFGLAAFAGLVSVVGISYSLGLTVDDFIHGAQTLVTNPSAFSQELIEGVKGLGPTGVVYYALIYMIAEILAVPATPLTLSAGYLFGLQNGILTVLVGATGAACVGFWISRTFLREYVESTLLAPAPDGSSPNTLAKLDKAISKEGFKLLVLIRLSPIFPFSVTNYLYGASSIDFGSYLFGTLVGFVPTTTAYVYTGMVGQALTAGNGGEQPWYVYVAGFAVLTVLVKLVTDVATGIIETIEED